MSYVTSGYLPAGDIFSGKEVKADEDVEEHKKLVASLCEKRDFTAHSLVAWNLHKRFDALHVVRGMYVALVPSECFGLLGVNGAGKTTTFQMLAALENVTYGEAYTATASLSGNKRRWQSQISYCFQSGGLLDKLNAYEYLYLIGRLRGFSDSSLKPMVDSIINVVDLAEHAYKESGVYSGGNRRKLSIGTALLGLQPLIFLDEPYAGVDIVSRNRIFRAIALIKKRSKSTFMLTSHNMDECEFSCDRLTIMVDGQMMCLGTLQHLREKFGRGYHMEFMLKHTAKADAPRLASAVQQLFPTVRLTDAHENVLSYHLVERIPWSELFTKMVQLDTQFPLEHALVGENTLEQIFLAFAKAQERRGVPMSYVFQGARVPAVPQAQQLGAQAYPQAIPGLQAGPPAGSAASAR
ncbi:phospholipid-transporting ATPase ABCA3-like [Dermacentor silvarum]|uniref:phospholipid-transporting ATPase ABCA3-like n=1 Tax=Dermacentor silvarum TaxID=543639 RepID=UPI0021013F82|nr:phospholipid-transporting ATPase ABCA3-like [Dermacentor silvarum]